MGLPNVHVLFFEQDVKPRGRLCRFSRIYPGGPEKRGEAKAT